MNHILGSNNSRSTFLCGKVRFSLGTQGLFSTGGVGNFITFSQGNFSGKIGNKFHNATYSFSTKGVEKLVYDTAGDIQWIIDNGELRYFLRK